MPSWKKENRILKTLSGSRNMKQICIILLLALSSVLVQAQEYPDSQKDGEYKEVNGAL